MTPFELMKLAAQAVPMTGSDYYGFAGVEGRGYLAESPASKQLIIYDERRDGTVHIWFGDTHVVVKKEDKP